VCAVLFVGLAAFAVLIRIRTLAFILSRRTSGTVIRLIGVGTVDAAHRMEGLERSHCDATD